MHSFEGQLLSSFLGKRSESQLHQTEAAVSAGGHRPAIGQNSRLAEGRKRQTDLCFVTQHVQHEQKLATIAFVN